MSVTERSTVGVYDVAVVEATGGEGLQVWLDEAGFAVDDETGARLQTYIDQGQHFLVAQITVDDLPEDRSWLPPLQLAYDADMVALPIWLGAASSSGEQDLLVFGITDHGNGAMGISNYPDARIADECLLDDLDTYLDEQWAGLLAEHRRAPWVAEFGWGNGKCDPCADGELLDDADLQAAGFVGVAMDAYFSRMHLRYTPEQIDGDVVLYESGIIDNHQLRFIEARPEMKPYFPACEGTVVEGDDECAEPDWEPPELEDELDWGGDDDDDDDDRGGGLCCGGSGFAFVVMGGGWMLRRRRRES